MKIALQISGRPRFTEASLGSLIGAIIEPLSPDIFCSFWQSENPNTITTYVDVLKPKLLEIEDQLTVRPYLDDLFEFNVHANMPSMSYKFYQISKLRQAYEKQANITYDIVIQARADNVFFEKLDLDRCQLALDKQAILCANQEYNPLIDHYVAQPRMVDNFYLGPTNLIDEANKTFWFLRQQCQQWTEEGQLYQIRIPEIIQSTIWQKRGIAIGGLPGSGSSSNFYYDIDRSETQWK